MTKTEIQAWRDLFARLTPQERAIVYKAIKNRLNAADLTKWPRQPRKAAE